MKCLEDANRLLQREIDKQLGGSQKDDERAEETKPVVATVTASDFDDDDPDGLMAAFFAKQKAKQESVETLPVEGWARNVVAARTNTEKRKELGDVKSKCQQGLVDHLCAAFMRAQNSSTH